MDIWIARKDDFPFPVGFEALAKRSSSLFGADVGKRGVPSFLDSFNHL
jgi:hypothetical protein